MRKDAQGRIVVTDTYGRDLSAPWMRLTEGVGDLRRWRIGRKDDTTLGGIKINASGRVCGIYLPSKGLAGEIPATIRNCDALTAIKLCDNELIGCLPEGIGSQCLPNIRILNVANNLDLEGEIPPSLMKMRAWSPIIDVHCSRVSFAFLCGVSLASETIP